MGRFGSVTGPDGIELFDSSKKQNEFEEEVSGSRSQSWLVLQVDTPSCNRSGTSRSTVLESDAAAGLHAYQQKQKAAAPAQVRPLVMIDVIRRPGQSSSRGLGWFAR